MDGTALAGVPTSQAQPSPQTGAAPVPRPAQTMPAIRHTPPEASPPPPSTPVTDPLVGMQLGEYVILEQIGIGGMGLVYRGEQPQIGKQVAIKVLRPDVGDQSLYVERLLAEARAVNAIRHRGIIDIFSFGKMPDGRQYFVMEYLEGTPLDIWLASRGTLPLQDAIRLADELLDALTAAHQAGVVHRDFKPNNVFLVRQPGGGSYVKVLDFGLAKQMSGDTGLSSQTLHGVIVGTPEYMAPEQVRGDAVSPKTDLYSFGIVLFQLLTGQMPFTARVPAEYLVHHLEHVPPSPLTLRPELSPALAQIVLKLLEKTPHLRPTAEEVRAVLQKAAESLPPPSGPRLSREMRSLALPDPQPVRPTPQQGAPVVDAGSPVTPPRPRLALKVGVATGVLLLTSGVAMLMLRRPAPVPTPVVAPTAPPVAETATPVTSPVAEASVTPPPVVPAPKPVASSNRPPSAVTSPSKGSTESPSKGSTESKPPLLVRIKRLEGKLSKSALPEDEKESARELLKKVRARAESASSAEERKQVQRNLDYWERQYLGD